MLCPPLLTSRSTELDRCTPARQCATAVRVTFSMHDCQQQACQLWSRECSCRSGSDMPDLGRGLRLPKAAAAGQVLLVIGLRDCVVPHRFHLRHHRALHATPVARCVPPLHLQPACRCPAPSCWYHRMASNTSCQLLDISSTKVPHDVRLKPSNQAMLSQTTAGMTLTPSSALSFSRCCLATAVCSSLWV